MNDFYYEIDEAVNAIDKLVEEDVQDVNYAVSELTNHLTILEYMLSRAPYYISDRGAVPTDIKHFNSIINNGVNYEGQHIPPFIEDREINKQEVAFLETTRNLLESEEMKEINRDISFRKFQDVISETIYGEYKYRLFSGKYIDAEKQ